ncbi:MAG: DHH family phosphoesterase [Oscillospiraceae bacterium]|nr:DHH family phosphoesterase [Oscillospiraceae bacterium]
MKKVWEYYETDLDKVRYISEKFNVSEILAKILVNRNILDDKELEVFLNPTRNDFYDAFMMLDIEKAVDRIISAINTKEKVIIYGDYDVDGITSIAVLKKFLDERGLIADYYIPNRLSEGYGLNKEAIEEIAKKNYTLIITVDCGISSIEEVEFAKKLGIEIIITDHHEQENIIPNAFAVVNPKRKESKYPFRELAGVGVAFKLIQAIGIKLGLDEKEYLKYLDIVAIGTISDIVPLRHENRVITKLGLKLLAMTSNMGLRELLATSGSKVIGSNTVSFGIAPKINACGRMGHKYEALELLLASNIEEVKQISQKLNEFNLERKEIEKVIFEEAVAKIEQEAVGAHDCARFECCATHKQHCNCRRRLASRCSRNRCFKASR